MSDHAPNRQSVTFSIISPKLSFLISKRSTKSQITLSASSLTTLTPTSNRHNNVHQVRPVPTSFCNFRGRVPFSKAVSDLRVTLSFNTTIWRIQAKTVSIAVLPTASPRTLRLWATSHPYPQPSLIRTRNFHRLSKVKVNKFLVFWRDLLISHKILVRFNATIHILSHSGKVPSSK